MLGGLRKHLLASGVREQANNGKKMRFSLKTLRVDVQYRDQMYGRRDTMDIWPRARTYSQSVTGKPYFHQSYHSSCFLVIELCFDRNKTDDRSFHSIQGYGASRKYLKELYGPSEYKLTWMLVVAFPALHVYFINIKHAYFVTLMKYIVELLRTLFCKNVSINKIMMRLVKLCM